MGPHPREAADSKNSICLQQFLSTKLVEAGDIHTHKLTLHVFINEIFLYVLYMLLLGLRGYVSYILYVLYVAPQKKIPVQGLHHSHSDE